MKQLFFTFVIFLSISINMRSQAQSLVDGFSKKKEQFTIVASYTHENYDQFFLAHEKVDIAMTGLDNIITQSINMYVEYGLSDRLDLIANQPALHFI